jgi:hypothetical protein
MDVRQLAWLQEIEVLELAHARPEVEEIHHRSGVWMGCFADHLQRRGQRREMRRGPRERLRQVSRDSARDGPGSQRSRTTAAGETGVSPRSVTTRFAAGRVSPSGNPSSRLSVSST